MRASRTYHDPLHGAITLNGGDPTEALLIQLIDTPAFQRLRRIRQLGPASVTFHGAEASRFTHSLGVMAIARRVFDRIAIQFPELRHYRATVLIAALLHDVGHGPFSHTCEEIFGCNHEHWTARIIRESPPIRDLLVHFNPGLTNLVEQNLVEQNLVEQIIQVYQKSHPVPIVGQLVSSQLDCDRLDYLMRDSYFTGAAYGKLDIDRILLTLSYDPASQQLIVAGKSLAAIEHYLIVRYFMYAQVYNHPKNISATWVLQKAFQRARELLQCGQLEADETIKVWLQQDCNQFALEHYLDADDMVFLYHLHRWRKHQDKILSDLCRRYIDRDLLKIVDVTRLNPGRQQFLLQAVRDRLNKSGLAGDYYAGLRTTVSRGYTLYQQGIKLQTESGLQEISELSPLVKTLIQPWQRSWLMYPSFL